MALMGSIGYMGRMGLERVLPGRLGWDCLGGLRLALGGMVLKPWLQLWLRFGPAGSQHTSSRFFASAQLFILLRCKPWCALWE